MNKFCFQTCRSERLFFFFYNQISLGRCNKFMLNPQFLLCFSLVIALSCGVLVETASDILSKKIKSSDPHNIFSSFRGDNHTKFASKHQTVLGIYFWSLFRPTAANVNLLSDRKVYKNNNSLFSMTTPKTDATVYSVVNSDNKYQHNDPPNFDEFLEAEENSLTVTSSESTQHDFGWLYFTSSVDVVSESGESIPTIDQVEGVATNFCNSASGQSYKYICDRSNQGK